jgi:diketogulonate reductase-like aldo/keto reductase
LDSNILQLLSKKYKKTSAQILLRWGLQHNIIEIPKSASMQHLKENADIFDFNIDKDDIGALDRLNEDFRLGDDPHLLY